MKKVFYNGLSFNGCSFIRELSPKTSAAGNRRRIAEWKCACGEYFVAAIGNVTSGQVASCGCKKTKAVIERCTKHGHSPIAGGSKLYRFWQSMKERCLNRKSANYHNYGGRGIQMFKPWRGSFEQFRAFFNAEFGLDDIPKNLTMDRKENDGNYEPGNLRFATLEVQANNRRNNRVVTYRGQQFTVAQLARLVGVKAGTLRARLDKQKLTIEQAIL